MSTRIAQIGQGVQVCGMCLRGSHAYAGNPQEQRYCDHKMRCNSTHEAPLFKLKLAASSP
jgi:hypothetical protein